MDKYLGALEDRMKNIGINDYWCELPKGRIKQLIGRSLTWKDEPVEKNIKGLEIWV